ncbi:aminotransferase-like domain-containing protein [Undibacterium squillarum]|uniref:Aminotransferase n=1 Tax=Undibacterium squillarum TaxID=1131567 RepID=A0ABQ2XS63_9BURK|nr:PLP-dependent aminotransferase family protein [Undibacterium squillarum]GGX31627.1 aminotransferase [Undibacterium squillarum]
MKLYEKLAEDIAQSIRTGTLRRGEKLPSVRQASEARAVSPATVYQAYYLLEARGLIRGKERSGYFVIAGSHEALPEARVTAQLSGEKQMLDVSSLIFSILESGHRDMVPLGFAFPCPTLFPMGRLAACMSQSLPQLDPWNTIDDLTPGSQHLRRQIALRYLTMGMRVHPDDVLITNGALEALNLALASVTQPGDTVVIESPAFYGALQAIERMGLQALEVPSHPRDGIDLNALESAFRRHQPKACWLMSNFQNPLGSTIPEQNKKAIVALATQYGVTIIEDDVYGELYFTAERPLPLKAWDSEGIVIHCTSFSKSLAPGYRVGWALAGKHTHAMIRQKLSTSLSTALPTQEALATFLSKGYFDRHLQQLRHHLSVQQSASLEMVQRYFPEGTRTSRPAGGYFLWLELPEPVDMLLIQRQAMAIGISITPGPMFSASRQFKNCMRLNTGHPLTRRHEQALKTLGQLISHACGIESH